MSKSVLVHYAKLNIEDVLKIEFESSKLLDDFLNEVIKKSNRKTVFLFSSNLNLAGKEEHDEFSREIIIESDPEVLLSIINRGFDYYGCEIFLQEYSSF